MNPQLNKKVKKYLDSYFRDTKTNSPEHQEAVMLILRGALTDANFHSEAKQLGKYFPKASKKYIGTPMEGVIEDKGIDIAKIAKWDGHDIIDAFAFYLSMSIGGSFGNRLMSLKESLEESLVSEGERLDEKNCPTNPSKWSYYKSQAKKKFDVYPSAYANGWASKQYKAAGGGWKSCKKESIDEKMVTPQRGHDYYQLTKDTPIKYVSGHSGIGLKVPGVLLHNEYDTIKGKKGAYIINYFNAHFYVDMKNKFASRIAHPQNREQNKDLMKNVERVFSAPEHSDWKKYMNESVNEADVRKKINRRGDVDGLIVTHNGNEYEIVYSGDFSMGSAVQPYGIVMPGDDVVSFLGKDKKAKSIWKKLKPKVDKFLKSNESVVNELNTKTYRSAVEKGLDRGDDKGREIARKAIELMGKSLSKELKDVVLTIKPLKVDDFHSSHFGGKPPMTGQYEIKFTGAGSLHKPDLDLDTKDITLFVKGEIGQAKEYGGWGGPIELSRYIGWKPITLQLSIRNGSVEVYSYRGGGGLQFTRQGARLIAKIAKEINLSMGGDGNVKHNKIKQFTPHKNESVNEVVYKDALVDFNKELEKNSEVKKAAKHYKKSTKDVVKALQSKIKVNRYSDKSIKQISIDYKEDGPLSSKVSIKLSKDYKQNESVNEAYIVTYAKKKGEKPASAAFSLRGSALSFERDLKKDGYITMVTQKKVKGVDESVNEAASRTAMEIGGYTGLNKNAVQKFIDDNNLDIEKVYQFVKKGKLADRMKLVSAIAGRPNNPVQKQVIKQFSESLIKEANVKLGKDVVNFRVSPNADKTGLVFMAASSNDLDKLQDAIASDVDVKGELVKILEKQLKLPVDIDYDYKGAGFSFKFDLYSISKKVK